jgi:hypothetical protein
MRPWVRNALTFGAISAGATLVLNAIGNATAGGTACHKSSPLGFLAFLLFLLLMGGAGYMTTGAGETVGMATLSGLVAALVSAVGTIIAFAIIFSSISPACVQPSNTTMPATPAFMAGLGVGAAIFLSLIGLGIGAGAAAIGGLIGKPRMATSPQA